MATSLPLNTPTKGLPEIGKHGGIKGSRVPVDRGWAWVVVAAAFGIYGLHGAAFKVQGIVYMEMIEHFGSEPQMTLWIFSIGGLFMLTAGPLGSVLIHKTSHRTTLHLGTALVVIGIVTSGYIPTIEMAFFTWSLLYGGGHSFLLMASLTCTAPYFEKYRGLAVGITAAGSGLLSFALPVLLRYLFDTLSYGGSMLIYGGITAHVFVFSMLVRPMSCYTHIPRPLSLKALGQPGVTEQNATAHQALPVAFESETLLGLHSENKGESVELKKSSEDSRSTPTCGCLGVECCHVHVNNWEVGNTPAADCMPGSLPAEDGGLSKKSSKEASCLSVAPTNLSGSLEGHSSRSILELLRDGPLVFIALTMMFFSNGLNIVYTVIPPYGEYDGVTKEMVSMMLAVGGGVEVVCRGLHGWFSDKKIISAVLQLAFCSGFTAIASIVCPILGGAAGIGVLSIACGMAGTSAFSLVPVVLHEIVESESVTSALGLQMVLRGFSFILSTFMTGFLVDKTGSWDAVFYYIGTNMFVSTFITLGVYAWKRRQRTRTGRDNLS